MEIDVNGRTKQLVNELVKWGVGTCGVGQIDVNEQNPHAVAVYEHWGFRPYQRTEHDDQGNPFPIIKMCLPH